MITAVTFSDFYSTVYQNGAFFLDLFGPGNFKKTWGLAIKLQLKNVKMFWYIQLPL